MIPLPFTGQTYSDKTLNANAQRAINWYPFHSPSTDNPNRIIMYPTPGFSPKLLCNSAGDGEIRAELVIRLTSDVLYTISGSNFYRIDTNFNKTLLGTLKTNSGRCSVVTNTVDIAISDGQYGYVYNLASGVFSNIGYTGGWPLEGVTNLTYQDGYYLALKNGSRTVIQSNLLDGTTWNALAFDTVTSFPDNGIAVFSDQNQAYVFGPHLTEVQYNAGSIPYAFQKVSGVLIQAGCAAKWSIVKVGTTLIWLADDIAGSPYIAMLMGYSPIPISTPPMNEAIARYPRIDDAFGYTYREGDNQFYSITFPSANNGLGATWVGEIKSRMWHERMVNSPFYPVVSHPPYTRDFPDFCESFNSQHIVGNKGGYLAQMSQDYFTEIDGTTALKRIRTCQHAQAAGDTIFINELHIDIETGVGDINSDPLVTLEMSRDYGHTWTTVGSRGLGKLGNYLKRLIFRNLGRVRTTLTFRLTVSDAVRPYLLGAWIKAKKGIK